MQEYTLKKSLGQHFLKDESICRQIVEALSQLHFSQLLEVGPGAGADVTAAGMLGDVLALARDM